MKSKLTALILAATLATGCSLPRYSYTPPDWRDYVTPGPDGINYSEVTSRAAESGNSKKYALRFARQACEHEGKRLTVHKTSTDYIGPSAAYDVSLTALKTVTEAYAVKNNTIYKDKSRGVLRWKTTTEFTCD